MARIIKSNHSTQAGYPRNTGRLQQVISSIDMQTTKVALMGDSTIDNGYWVDENKSYLDKTATVTHQTALALSKNNPDQNFDVANFAIDGATTTDIDRDCLMCKVLPEDQDHPLIDVHQMNAVQAWQPDVIALSVGGNNYREALQGTLRHQMSMKQLLFRQTPESAKEIIKESFTKVKEKLLQEYKALIDKILETNPNLNRLVLMSQYYPSLTQFTPYFIYTGFSHVANSEGLKQTAFECMTTTMNELYSELLTHVLEKDTDVVLVDVTSSLNPLEDNHTKQIEPNESGAKVMGELISAGVTYKPSSNQSGIRVLKQVNRSGLIETSHYSNESAIQSDFSVKSISAFISDSRYSHVNHFFRPQSSLKTRFESAYHMLVGKQFDASYTGLFAFGLLDASLITVAADYLWRVALDTEQPQSIQLTAGIVSAPIILAKLVVGLSALLILGLPILGYDAICKATLSSNSAERDIETDLSQDLMPSML